MRISVFGLGYVGTVSAACLARDGHTVCGVDVHQVKVDLINSGKSAIVEAGIDEIINSLSKSGRLYATSDPAKAVQHSEISLICVGTPSNSNGSLNIDNLRRVCVQIGRALRNKADYHNVVVRSTVLPGTLETIVICELEEHSGKKPGVDFSVSLNPEFLREGSALKDYYSPPFILIGAQDRTTADAVRRLYNNIDANVFVVSIKAAEMLKYACNSFHALKIGFANEIGNVCKQLGIDSHEVMKVFCDDTKLNLSAHYLTPGFAFGGSCLPKDLRAINYKAKELDVEVPVLNSILRSNKCQIERALDMVLRTGRKRIGVLGISFKAGTDDMRESPMVTMVETLIGKGKVIAIYDRHVSLGRILGANKDYIEHEIPHISQLMRSSIQEVIDCSEILIIGNKEEEFRSIENLLRHDQRVIDLVRLFPDRVTNGPYEGLCW